LLGGAVETSHVLFVERDLAYLDAAGIDLAGLSISARGVHFGDNDDARTLTRRSNEYLADLVRDRPDPYAALAAIPLPDLDGAITELDYALSTLGLDGLALRRTWRTARRTT
jgi:aminocarboxymuconate-semialdehyde decarboxylase